MDDTTHRGGGYNPEYQETPNVVDVSIDEDAPNGPGMEFLDAQTGSSLGTVQTNGEVSHQEYVEAEGLLLVSTTGDHLYAVDPRSATVRWEARAPNIGSVTEERVYGYSDATLWAYDLSTGAEQWEHVLPDSLYSTFRIQGINPINDSLYIIVGEYDDRGIVSIDSETGDENWYCRPGDVKELMIEEEGLYITRFASDDREDEVARIDERTGADQWSFVCASGPSNHRVELDSESLFVGESVNGTAAAIDRVTGSKRWRSEEYYDCEGIWLGEPALYVDGEGRTGDEFENKFHAVDRQTGRTKWEQEIDDYVKSCDVDSVQDAIYIGTRNYNDGAGTVYRLAERTGRLEWQCNLGERVRSIYPETNPVIVRTREEMLYAIDDDDGQPIWSLAGGERLGMISVTDERIGVSTDYDGATQILRRADGSVEAQFEASTAAGGGALFALQGQDLSAYPMASEPGALRDESARRSGTSTEIFSIESGAPDNQSGSGNTRVFDSNPTDGGPDSSRDSRAVMFCPSCGTDLSEYGDVQFCPACGTEIPD